MFVVCKSGEFTMNNILKINPSPCPVCVADGQNCSF